MSHTCPHVNILKFSKWCSFGCFHQGCFIDPYPCWKNSWKAIQTLMMLFLDEKMESVQKNGHSWVLPMVGIDPTHLLLGFPGVSGEHTLNLYVCGTALWDTLGFFPGAVAGVSLWTQCALNEAGLVSSFPSQRVENMIAPHIWYMIDMQCLSSQNQRPRSNSFFVQSWSSALKFRKCWIWGMKNWIASGKTMCWTGLLFTSTLEPRWKMPDFSWSGPTFWLKPRRFSRSNRGLEVGRLDG